MKYLIAYDIAHPRRLARVARHLERHAFRCQKSVFLAELTPGELERLLDELAERIDWHEDCIQAWRLTSDQPAEGQVRGTCQPLMPATVVWDADAALVIGSRHRART